MQIPAILFGTSSEVRRRVAKDLKRSTAPSPADASFDDLVDMKDRSDALIVLSQESRHIGGKNFHVYMPLQIVQENFERERSWVWFEQATSSAWSLAGLMGANTFFVNADFSDPRRVEQRRSYLEAVRRFGDEMDAVGRRFRLLVKTDIMSNLELALHYILLKKAGFEVRSPSPAALRSAIASFLLKG